MAITFCGVQDVIDLAGLGASSYGPSSLLIQRFINRAEGKIVSSTRQNWLSAYSSTTSQNKELLREATASKAAIDLAKYDSRGFINSTEQQTVLDILWDQWTAALQELKDLDISKTRNIGG